MLEPRLSCVKVSDAKFFEIEQGIHLAINDMGPVPLPKLGAEVSKVSTRIVKSVDGSSVEKVYFDLYL